MTKYLHTNSWAGFFATPCEVISQSKGYATVKLLADLQVGRWHYKKHDIKARVPLNSLSDQPRRGAHVVTT